MPERNIKETKSALPKEKNSEKKDENPQKTRTKKARLQNKPPASHSEDCQTTIKSNRREKISKKCQKN